MKILVVGSGGREHALVWKIKQSPLITKIFAAPGNAGMERDAECVPVKADDLQGLLKFAQSEKIDLTVVGPEVPLVAGLVDLLHDHGLLAFGPSAKAARLEGSKIFSKECMNRFGVPTAAHGVCENFEQAKQYLLAHQPPFVIKADGLAQGKGVMIVESRPEGARAATQILEDGKFGEAGRKIVMEEFLKGEEVSVLAFTDGRKIVPLASAQDYKRVFDGDGGPNTGGMGAYSPCPAVTDSNLEMMVAKAIKPMVEGLASEGIVYRGMIYAGLIMTEKGPFVLEYNVRFGDPEAQVLLARLDQDIVPLLMDTALGNLKADKLRWKSESALSVVLISEGYPLFYITGHPITGWDQFEDRRDLFIFHAGTSRDPVKGMITAGGRVFSVTALGASLEEARQKAYQAAEQIKFKGVFYRKEIGSRALAASRKNGETTQD